MFERFTDEARRVVVYAQDESGRLSHEYIGTEHLLLGLLREGDGVAGQALDSLGISLQAARDRLEAAAGRGPGRSGHIPFTPEAKRALELSLREAMQLGHDYIGTEHLLLGLVHDSTTFGARLLADLGAGADAIRQRVIERVPPNPAGQTQRHAERGPRARLSADPGAGYGALSNRLAALERWAGLAPDVADLDAQLAQVRRGKEAAIDAHEFRTAEALSDTEHDLMAERERRSRQRAAGPTLAGQVAGLQAEVAGLQAEVAGLQAEVDRLQDVLRRHGIDPGSAP